MKTLEHWQRYMSLGVPSAEAPRGHGCIPLELIDVVGFWAPPPDPSTTSQRSGNQPSGVLDLSDNVDLAKLGTPFSSALDLSDIVKLSNPKFVGDQFHGLLDLKRQSSIAIAADPHGLDPHQPGAKLDAGKNRLGLVMRGFTRALFEVGRVGTYGAEKYTDNGWVKVEGGKERYTDAAYRHLAEDELNWIDTSTTLFHLAQAAWNLLAVLELRLREMER